MTEQLSYEENSGRDEWGTVTNIPLTPQGWCSLILQNTSDKENMYEFELPPIRKGKSSVMKESVRNTKPLGSPSVLNFLNRKISNKKDSA